MKRGYILELVEQICGNKVTAEAIVDRLQEEDLLKTHYGDDDIGKIVDAFKDTFGVTKATKYDRFAAKRLAAKHGTEAVCQIILLLKARADHQYAPVINSVAQMETKWVSVLKFLRASKPVEVEL